MEIVESTAYCIEPDNKIYLQVFNPYSEIIYANEIQIEYTMGGCDTYNTVDEFPADILDMNGIWFDGCTIGTNTIKIISPEGFDQISVECE